MKRKSLLITCLVMVLVLSLVGACAKPAPAPAPAPAPGPPEKVFEWTLFNNGPNLSFNEYVRDRIAPGIENVTGGRVKIDVLFPGDHPYATADLLGTVKEGACDLSQFSLVNVSGSEPRLTIEDLPFLVPPGGLEGRIKFHHALDDFRADFLKGWNCHLILATFDGPQQLWLIDGWVEDFDSLSGKRIRGLGADFQNTIVMLGGLPVNIAFGEVYTALQTGLIEGLITGATGAYKAKFEEVVKHMIPMSFCQTSSGVFLNNDSWNELPPDLQNIVSAYLDKERHDFELSTTLTDGMYLNAAFQEYDLEVKPAPKAFTAEVRKRAKAEVWDKWAERVGPEGKDALEAVLNIAKTIQ